VKNRSFFIGFLVVQFVLSGIFLTSVQASAQRAQKLSPVPITKKEAQDIVSAYWKSGITQQQVFEVMKVAEKAVPGADADKGTLSTVSLSPWYHVQEERVLN